MQRLELTELEGMERQPDVVAKEGARAGPGVAMQMRAAERYTVIKVVVRCIGKLPRKKSQHNECVAATIG